MCDIEEILLTVHFYYILIFMQRLPPTGNKSGIGITARIGKISKRMSGSMCNGFMIIAIGGEGEQEEHLQ